MSRDTVRAARPSDHARFVALFAELGVPEPPPDLERWTQRYLATTVFLERDGAAVGYAWYEVLGEDGYVRHVVTDARQRRSGVGRALMAALEARFGAAGCARWRLNVKRDNAAALALYASLGLRVEHPSTVVRLPWRALGEREHPPRAVLDVPPARDATLEREFGLPEGRLASARRAPQARVLEARDGAAVEALAAFDPALPGCFPFRARSLAAAESLLRALAPPAPPEDATIQLVVEDSPALAAWLGARGARLIFELFHLSGPLPASR